MSNQNLKILRRIFVFKSKFSARRLKLVFVLFGALSFNAMRAPVLAQETSEQGTVNFTGLASRSSVVDLGNSGHPGGCNCAFCRAASAQASEQEPASTGQSEGTGGPSAATITTPEAALDAIFSQAAFGSNPIDIRFAASVEFEAPELLTLDSNAETSTILNSSSVVSSPGVNAFFVDEINFCGGPGSSIIGCANVPGNDLVVDSGAAAGFISAELIGHELGHNLGLSHEDSVANLLSSSIDGNTSLSASQVATILNSPLVQTDTDGSLFIEITPILVVDQIFIPGDVNGDDVVDEFDFFIIRDNLNTGSADRLDGDVTGDGLVNLDDFAEWRNNVSTSGLIAAGFAVPEPATLTLVCMAGMFGIGRRPNRSRD